MGKTCTVVEQPIRWENVTSRHLMKFKEFIDDHDHTDKDKPFFYQHAFTSVHVPWIPSRFFVTDPGEFIFYFIILLYYQITTKNEEEKSHMNLVHRI